MDPPGLSFPEESRLNQAGREAAAEELYREYAAVPVLAGLAHGREPVRGSGPLDSPFMVVGEAPGAEGERLRRPFAGPSGEALRELFRAAGIPWELCYATDVVGWRPPGNRTPYPFEVQASRARLAAEIALADREVIVAAGSVPWSAVTGDKMGRFDDARFKWHDLDGTRLLAVPHPSTLLRIRDAGERRAWEQAAADALRQAMQEAGA